MNRKKIALSIAGFLAALILLGAVSAVFVLRSDWFHEKVRQALIRNMEDATGGRAELGAFRFDWRQMRIEVRDLVLHGSEPAGKPPLARAAAVTVGLKIISFITREINVQSVDIQNPNIYLIIYPDGHTNVPEPKIKRRSERTALETLVNLAIGQFNIQNGIFEVESHSRTPFSARGRNLGAIFRYEAAGPRYLGDISIQPLEVQWDGRIETPVGIQLALALEKNRIAVSSAQLASGTSKVEFSGAVEDLVSPRASFRYEARISAMDVSRGFQIRGLEGGTADLAGSVQWAGGAQYSVSGNVRAAGVAFHQDSWRVRNLRAEGTLFANSQGAQLGGLRFSADALTDKARLAVEGSAKGATLRGDDLEVRGVELASLGGTFRGDARLRKWTRFEVHGDLQNLEAKRAVSLYSREPLPWNSSVSGSVQIEGSLQHQRDLRLIANLTAAPAPQSAPVRGQLAVTYDQQAGTLELGQSTLLLPASRLEASGSIGRQLRVHLETRDIADFRAVLGESAESIPLRLDNGSVVFDGTITGNLERPTLAGHVTMARFVYDGRAFDALQADVNGSPDSVRVQNVNLARGAAHAQFQASVGLHDWKTSDASGISGSGTMANAALTDLMVLLGQKGAPVTGTLDGSGQVGGTIGNPQWSADVQIAKGSIKDEPFDRVALHVSDSGRMLQVSSGQMTAGAKRVQFAGALDHPARSYDTGRLRFEFESNILQLAEIHTLAQARPDLGGTVQFKVAGTGNLAAGPNSAPGFRITELNGELTARGLRVSGQTVGDTHVTASSQGETLRAHLDTNFNGSALRGDGEWKMEGDYPGNATVTFTKLDLAALREWVAPSQSRGGSPIGGYAEGELQINGPALKPELLKADLRMPNLEIRAGSGAASMTFRNSGPVVASMANSVVTIQRAELTGRSTDITIGGRIAFTQKSPLDVRVNGRADLALLQTINADLNASGMATIETSIRGTPGAPQINGRLELKDATLTYAMLPNGISDANGVIVFTGDRATIQKLEGTTGGGSVQISGFTGYDEDGIIFGLHATAQKVRVRYPEGVSTVADARLDFTGSPDRSLVAGSITIERAGVNLQSDLGTLLAKSAEPVRTPASSTGFLNGLNFDVQIQTAPDIEFESALTQDIQADANLRLRGTATNPALLGRINITQGQIVFFGTKYTISQGSISFFNAVKVEPVLNVDLETRARGIDITLTVAGPLNKLTVTPRSDPPLQFSEIVSVLTTGQAPASDVTRLGQQGTTQQQFPSSATALLGQVIANPVSGRLQRFFGISNLRINPTLDPALAGGVQYTPQARLTLEQQVTPNITFTYITDVTNANPQVVSVEWSVNKQWSVVAQREENGLFGIDFYLKKRFK